MLPLANMLIVGILILVLLRSGGSYTVSHPVLTVSPDYKVYMKGEAIMLMCKASGDPKTKHFYFYKDSIYIHTDNTYLHRIHSLHYADAGTYACEFWEISYPSTRSKEISIIVIDKPSAPMIFLAPSHPIYNIGDSFDIICSLPSGIKEKKALFYKAEPGGYNTLSHGNAIYRINKAGIETDGKYYCIYTAEIMDRCIDSLKSKSILINISESTFPSTSMTSSTTTPVYTTQATISDASVELATSTIHVSITQSTTIYYSSQKANVTIKEDIQKSNSHWYYLTVIFKGLILVYMFIKCKKLKTAVLHSSEHNVNTNELQDAVALPESPFMAGNMADLEEYHVYSEIVPPPTVLPQSSLTSFYKTVEAIDMLPPMYMTALTPNCD